MPLEARRSCYNLRIYYLSIVIISMSGVKENTCQISQKRCGQTLQGQEKGNEGWRKDRLKKCSKLSEMLYKIVGRTSNVQKFMGGGTYSCVMRKNKWHEYFPGPGACDGERSTSRTGCCHLAYFGDVWCKM